MKVTIALGDEKIQDMLWLAILKSWAMIDKTLFYKTSRIAFAIVDIDTGFIT